MKLVCANCKKEFERSRLYSKVENSYCSQSCAAQNNNRKHPKRQKLPDKFCKCGNTKERKAKTCVACMKLAAEIKRESLTVETYTLPKASPMNRYNQIRKDAKLKTEAYKIPKYCRVCGFDSVVELCHKKSIGEFPKTSLVKEVNSLSNLIYLCPNHHAMLDKGLLSVLGSLEQE